MTAKKSVKKKVSKHQIVKAYMETLLISEETPKSIFKFSKENNFSEAEFYNFFSSFEHLKQQVWVGFFDHTMEVLQKDPAFENYSNREKMLAFLYTFFEVLTANRSYALYVLPKQMKDVDQLRQLKELRTHVKNFASELIRDGNESTDTKLLKQSEKVFSEGAWVQVMFLINYWRQDTSASFEKTDLAIEKSVRAIFDVFNTQPLESLLDFGKFLWKERFDFAQRSAT